MATSIAFKFIKPRRDYRVLGEKVARQLEAQLDRDADGILADFEKTTATWTHQVLFEKRILMAAGSRVAYIFTKDEIYKFVDFGTQGPYPIPKTGTAHLVFQWGGPGSYKAKTRSGVIGSRGGGATGPIVHRRQVTHPGIEARRFTETIQKKWEKQIPKGMADVVRGAVS